MWAGIGRAEVEVALIPFSEDVYQIVESRILRRRFKMVWLEAFIYQLSCLCENLRFY